MGVFRCPAGRQSMLVQIARPACTPVDMQWGTLACNQALLDNGLDRRKAGAAREQDQWFLFRVLQVEATVRPLEAQDVTHFGAGEQRFGECAARHMTNVQFQQTAGGRCIGQGKAALAAILEQDVDVLPGMEIQRFGSGQAQLQDEDVGGRFVQVFDAGGQGLDRQGIAGAQLGAFDGDIAAGTGAAEQGQAGRQVRVTEPGLAVIDFAAQHLALAGPAGPVAAAMR